MSEDTEKVVELANVYVKAGENFINAIKKAQDEIEKEEREKYDFSSVGGPFSTQAG